MSSSPGEPAPGSKPVKKRIRVLLSCAPCRNSKLKCDRQQPCNQCEKKARVDQCVYAPKPAKKKSGATNVTARLKRLEGLVRNMMDNEDGESQPPINGNDDVPSLQGHVVRGKRGTSYVGATHCMAMLEDIEDLKMYFGDSDEQEEDEGSSPDNLDVSEMMLMSRGSPSNRDELLAQLPERHVVDRLITRYFSSMSPSQHIIHKPTFSKQYSKFWQDPNSASTQWLAQVFMMLAMGTFFNNHTAPHELGGDSPVPVFDRIKHYRSCAGWALISSKYTQPTTATLPAFMLFVESHFLFNRPSQMNCYILSGVCIRLLLKMGLHRDPSKLANISPFEGEMRRRIWNMGVQIELLVSFHMGLPSMLQGIETDTRLASNLQDEDFDETSESLPPERPDNLYTHMTYPINKTRVLRVFGQIVQQAHSLRPPSYDTTLHLDSLLKDARAQLPSFMAVRPLDECVGEAPVLLTQRFGLSAVYNKCRCVLHRRYLAEAIPIPEHNYSRQQCLEAALTLLDQQDKICTASKPGGILGNTAWLLSSLAVHDYLLAAMILYLFVSNERYPDPEAGFDFEGRKPSKSELKAILKRSWEIWTEVSDDMAELRKTADMLAAMLARLGDAVGGRGDVVDSFAKDDPADNRFNPAPSSTTSGPQTATDGSGEPDLLSSFGLSGSSTAGLTPFSMGQESSAAAATDLPSAIAASGADFSSNFNFDNSWMQPAGDMDWRFLDVSLANVHSAAVTDGPGSTWIEKLQLDDLSMMGSGPAAWGQTFGE